MARTDLAARTRALAILGITDAQLARYPTITPQLREISKVMRGSELSLPYGMGSDIRVSWPKYLQMSDDSVAVQVLGAYLQVDRTFRSAVPVEAYCLVAGVAPSRILEIIQLMCIRLSGQASQIIAALNHPRVVQKTVDMALTDEGIEDRTLLHKATGFLPTAKGPSQVVNVNTSATASAQAATVVAAPPAENTIRRMVDRFNDARPTAALPPTSAIEIPQSTREADPVTSIINFEDD